MNKYHYDFRDIFKAPRMALHGKNIYLQMRNLLVGYIGYVVIAYLALMVEGIDLKYAWDVNFIFPIGTLGIISIWGKLVWLIAIHWFIICLLRGNLAVSKSAFEEIKGNLFFSSAEARKFVSEKHWAMGRAYMAVVAFIVFMVVLGLIAGLIGKIPVVGELSFGLFYGFPYYILSLFAVLIIFLFTTFVLTGPAAVGVKGEDTLTTLFDGFSVVTSRPLRWTIYTASSVVIAKVCSFVLFYFSFRAFQFTNYTTGVFMGDKGKIIFQSAIDKFPASAPLVQFLSFLYPGSNFGIDLYMLGAFHPSNTIYSIATYLVTISISLVFLFIIAYFINTVVVGQVIAFIDIRRQTHNDNLAEMSDDELFDDFKLTEEKKTDSEKSDDKPSM